MNYMMQRMKAEDLDNKMATIRQDIDDIEACSNQIMLL